MYMLCTMRTSVRFAVALLGFASLAAGYPSCANFTFSSKQLGMDTLPAPSRGNALQKPREANRIHQNIKGAEWNALKVRYSRDDEGYYDLPWSVEEATAQGKWQKIDQDNKLNVDVFSQPQDPRLLLLFDKKGTIAGIRLAFLKKDVPRRAEEGGYSFDFDYDNNPMYEESRYFGKELWHTTVLLASLSELAAGGRRNLNKDTDDVATGVYFKHDGEWTEMSKDECKPNKEFVEGKCVAGMGKHYFYKLNNTDCKHQQPLWSLYDNGTLMGIGLAGYGSFTKSGKTQNYYEHGVIPATLDLLPLCFSDYTIFSIFSLDAIKIVTMQDGLPQFTASRGQVGLCFSEFSLWEEAITVGGMRIMRKVPPCIEEYTEKFGLTMMHVFLKNEASTITCPPKEWHLAHCRLR